MSAFWSGHVGAAAGCCCRVLVSECGVRYEAGGWLRDVYGSVRLGVAKKYLLLSGAYAI